MPKLLHTRSYFSFRIKLAKAHARLNFRQEVWSDTFLKEIYRIFPLTSTLSEFWKQLWECYLRWFNTHIQLLITGFGGRCGHCNLALWGVYGNSIHRFNYFGRVSAPLRILALISLKTSFKFFHPWQDTPLPFSLSLLIIHFPLFSLTLLFELVIAHLWTCGWVLASWSVKVSRQGYSVLHFHPKTGLMSCNLDLYSPYTGENLRQRVPEADARFDHQKEAAARNWLDGNITACLMKLRQHIVRFCESIWTSVAQRIDNYMFTDKRSEWCRIYIRPHVKGTSRAREGTDLKLCFMTQQYTKFIWTG